MANRNMPVVIFAVAAIVYTLVFFHDFPTRSKESIVRLLDSADAVDLCFYASSGSNLVACVNDIQDLTMLSARFEKSSLISLPEAKCVIFGRAVFFAQDKEILRMDFCSFPVVLIDGRSYAVSPDFTLLARFLVEERNKK